MAFLVAPLVLLALDELVSSLVSEEPVPAE